MTVLIGKAPDRQQGKGYAPAPAAGSTSAAGSAGPLSDGEQKLQAGATDVL
jgi:hypothetical protein